MTIESSLMTSSDIKLRAKICSYIAIFVVFIFAYYANLSTISTGGGGGKLG